MSHEASLRVRGLVGAAKQSPLLTAVPKRRIRARSASSPAGTTGASPVGHFTQQRVPPGDSDHLAHTSTLVSPNPKLFGLCLELGRKC